MIKFDKTFCSVDDEWDINQHSIEGAVFNE